MSFVLQKPCILCSMTHSQVTPLPLQDLPIFYVNASKSFPHMYHKDSASTHFESHYFKLDWHISLHSSRYITSFDD